MSAEAEDRSEHETVEDVAVVSAIKKDAICKDENENMVCGSGEASSNGINSSPSYVLAYTLRNLDVVRGPKFYCHECKYFLHTLLSMTTHMKMHRKPFCPICFRLFAHGSEVNAHLDAVHSMLLPNFDCNVFVEDGSAPFEAPPNSPTQEHQERAEVQAGRRGINDQSISFLLTQKLRKHQAKINRAIRLEAVKLKARRASANDAEIRGAGKASTKTRLAGKVHKNAKSKLVIPSTTNRGEELTDNSLRRLTSRFGRAISLKVPQF